MRVIWYQHIGQSVFKDLILVKVVLPGIISYLYINSPHKLLPISPSNLILLAADSKVSQGYGLYSPLTLGIPFIQVLGSPWPQWDTEIQKLLSAVCLWNILLAQTSGLKLSPIFVHLEYEKKRNTTGAVTCYIWVSDCKIQPAKPSSFCSFGHFRLSVYTQYEMPQSFRVWRNSSRGGFETTLGLADGQTCDPKKPQAVAK